MGVLDVPAVPRSTIAGMIDQRVDPLADLASGQPFPFTRKYLGPLSTDAPTITMNAAPDASYNKSYLIASGSIPADYPIDLGPGPHTTPAGINYSVPVNNQRVYRFYMDGLKMAFQSAAVQAGVDSALFYVDGAPVSFTPSQFTVGGTGLNTIVFGTAKPRLIEILTNVGIGDVYTHNPYRLYKPAPRVGPRVLVVGDSYVLGTVFSTSQTFSVQGVYAQMPWWLGTENYWTDGEGGSGYLKTASGGMTKYRDRLARQVAANPDVVIVHGGGANDLYQGFATVTQIVTEASLYFQALRTALPTAKLVFVEGFSPPNGFSTFNASYTSIRSQLQTALSSIGVYYIDVATSSAWLDGLGYVGNTTGSGNSDIYVGSDGIHLTPVGAQYVLGRLVPKYRAVLADDGTLLNALI